jgi:hypothetical protein
LRLDGARDDDAVDGLAEASGFLLDQLRGEGVPGGRVASIDQLVCELAAEVVEARGLVLGEVAVEMPVEVRRSAP